MCTVECATVVHMYSSVCYSYACVEYSVLQLCMCTVVCATVVHVYSSVCYSCACVQ